MARVSLNQTNFTAGEISPRTLGRVDIDRYNNGARKLVNAYPVIHGGAKRRGGTRFVKATKIAAKRSRLIPFVYSRDNAYMLELGENYVRIYGAGGVDLSVELPTSYTESMLTDIDYAQGSDTMFVAHPSVAIQRLRRFGPTTFDFSAAPFATAPFDEQGHALAANITLSLATVGAGRTITASTGVFLPTDVGRRFISDAGVATITGYTSTTVLVATISVAFSGVAIASGAWKLDGSPQAILKPSASGPVGSTVNLLGSLTRAANITLSGKTGAITINADSAIFTAGDTGKTFYADSGRVQLTFVSAVQCSGTTSEDFASSTYPTGGYGITESTWRAGDVGSFVRLNTGLAKITGFIDSTSVQAQIQTALSNIVVAPSLAWSLETTVWTGTNGYPRTVTLHEQRLLAAGSTAYPQTIWGSRTAEYLDYTKGVADDDAFSFTIAADEVNPVSYLASMRNLLVHTYGGEFSMQGGVEKPITPTSVRVRPETNHGSKGVRPITVGKESVFVQRAGKKLRTLAYTYQDDGYDADDLTTLAEHVTDPDGISAMAFQQEPDRLVWAVRGDGALLSCTLDRRQSVVGWARHFTQGVIESVATIPNGDTEETWVIVRRTVNGATARYLEIIDDTWEPLLPGSPSTAFPTADDAAALTYGYTVDCGLAFDNVLGQSTFSVPHLIGNTVDIVADGWVKEQQLVPASGNITIDRISYRTLIGLHFKSEIGLLTPEVGTGSGTAQGNSMRTSEITMRFLNTIGATVLDGDGNEQEVGFRSTGVEVLDAAPQAFTGIKRLEKLGWERGRDELTIVQDQPLPMHLLSVVRKFTVND